MPTPKVFETWYDQSPVNYRFAVKAPRQVTHYKKFNAEAQPILADFYGTVREGLRKKLGPVLFQLPPKAEYSDELAQRLVESLDPTFSNVVEFRHPSWWAAEPQRLLTRHGIAFVGQRYPPPLALPDEVVATTSVLYYRFHGVPDLYRSSYSPEFLARIAAEIQSLQAVQQVYLYFTASAAWACTMPSRCRRCYPPKAPGLAGRRLRLSRQASTTSPIEQATSWGRLLRSCASQGAAYPFLLVYFPNL